MTILITGGNGFIGKTVEKYLRENTNEEVKVLIRKNASYRKENVLVSDYSKDDLTEKIRNVDVVIHLAGKRILNKEIENDSFCENEKITKNLLEACKENSIKNFIFSSSISVYSNQANIPWTENEEVRPISEYAKSKVNCENICLEYSKKYGISVKILRIAHVLGKDERKGYMMNTFIDQAFNHETLIVRGKSIAKREFIYVNDVAKAIYKSIEYPNTDIFNIGSGIGNTNLEIAMIVNEVFDNKNNLRYIEDEDEKIKSSIMNTEKSKLFMGFQPSYTLKSALEEIKREKEGK